MLYLANSLHPERPAKRDSSEGVMWTSVELLFTPLGVKLLLAIKHQGTQKIEGFHHRAMGNTTGIIGIHRVEF